MKSKTIKVDYLARVEGEGAISLRIRDHRVTGVKVNIFEPPRFFEAFLRGRKFSEVPDITARICGICPVAYQMSSCQAIEDAFGMEIPDNIRVLRRLLYCGEWIESHALHIYMLHAPDFLGYEDAIAMAKDHADAVKRGLRLKKIGNAIVALLGGREIHPVNVRVGGFYRIPAISEFKRLSEDLKWARNAALETVRWITNFTFPDFERDYTFVALRDSHEYPMNQGRVASSSGLDIAVRDYDRFFAEEHVPHSNALHSVMKEGGAYFTGPQARFNLNFDRLPEMAKETAREAGIEPPVRNPFRSIIVRSIELLFACEEALQIIAKLELPATPAIEAAPVSASGFGCTEAPRGILYHRYRFDEHGVVLDAKIVPPTSQNQRTMEADLREFASTNLNLPMAELQRQCEQAVRNYDPCISCATHLVRFDFESR